jgi:phosphoenolpyruvate carboxykinase (ATP)
MDLKMTRAIIDGIHDGSLNMKECQIMRRFGFKIPIAVKGVDRELLRPIEGWSDKEAYKKASLDLALSFHKNFQRYIAGVPLEVVKYGGPNLDV